MNVVGARENVGGLVVQQFRVQCFNCKEFGHFAKECRKPKRVKDSAYRKEKMLMCKQAEKVPLQNKQTVFEKYKAFNDRTVDYEKLKRKLNETLGQLAQKDIEIKEGLVKKKTNVITDLKLMEEHDIDKMLSMEKQLKFLSKIVYKRSQSIQTIHMMAPKVPTYNGRPTTYSRWTKDYPLKQVHRNPLQLVQIRRQLAKDHEMYMFALTAKYTLEIPHKHGMDKGQSIGTPIATKPKLDADLSGNPIDQTDYRSKIRSLMYLTSSRPDIVQVVCYCARYQSRPTEKHLKEVKRIFRYLRGTINMGLWYPKGYRFGLIAFSDADHAGCIDTCKSTPGGIQFLGDKLVSWMSKKQDCTAMSSTEAKYMALSTSYAQVMWIRTQLQDYGLNYNNIPLYCDSQSAIAISCSPVQHSHTKHIHTRYHFIKEHVENGIIELYFARTEYQLADMFIKALPEDRFKYLVKRIDMRCLTLAELEVLAKESA
nr:retrovirus-related Pol polyprotein from transposon TNT 1-94 [Tanacetum cinerariifolium]